MRSRPSYILCCVETDTWQCDQLVQRKAELKHQLLCPMLLQPVRYIYAAVIPMLIHIWLRPLAPTVKLRGDSPRPGMAPRGVFVQVSMRTQQVLWLRQ
jgi:hypothetical protein